MPDRLDEPPSGHPLSDAAPARTALVLLVDATGAILLQLRDDRARVAPNMWALPGGHIEPGEDPLHAAERELQEETGIRARNLRPFWQGVRQIPGVGAVHSYVFWAPTTATQEEVVVGEGREMVFTSIDRMVHLDLTSNARDILAEFVASGEYRTATQTPSI